MIILIKRHLYFGYIHDMKNTIAERVFDFLKDFPPFDCLESKDLEIISRNVTIRYIPKNENVFTTDEEVHDHFYIVKDGAIGIFRDQDKALVDQCDEGDIFGLRALIRKGNYILNAEAIEESIIYCISSELLENNITINAKANKYLLASFVSNIRNPYAHENSGFLENQVENIQQSKTHFTELHSVSYSKDPVTCLPNVTIKLAAQVMSSKKIGSIIITDAEKPLGIVTDKDLRTKVATGFFSIDQSVDQIMSSPVIAFAKDITVAEAQIAMLQHKISHLCITEDGTANSKLLGILSEHDIVVLQSNTPTVLIKAIERSSTDQELKYIRQGIQELLLGYMQQQIPIPFILKIIAVLNKAVIEKAVLLSLAEMHSPPPIEFAFLALGSQGRNEQLLLTDQDNALIFKDVPEEKYTETKNYFLTLALKINHKLNTIGFEYCPAEMMANNPQWCLSVSQWKQQFYNWITTPDKDQIMLCTIFFDYDFVYGDNSLVKELSESIFESIKNYNIFLNFLGLDALKNPPPLSFFRQFLVESSGEHKDQFDIKARAIMPLVDAARLLVLSHNFKKHNNTVLRYQKLAQIEPQNKTLYLSCITAFQVLTKFRTLHGLQQNTSGRFIDLKSITKEDKLRLKRCFTAIKEIQQLIQVRFNLSQIL